MKNKSKKLEGQIFSLIHDVFGDKMPSENDFWSAYRASLIFIFHTQYGLPVSTIMNILYTKEI